MLSSIDIETLIIGVAVFVTVRWYMYSRRRSADLPPGPFSWPVLGSIPSLVFYRGAPHEMFHRLSQKYGPIVRVDLVAGRRVVVLHGYDVIHEAFHHHPGLDGRPSLSVFKQVLKGGVGIVGASGESWKIHRRITLNFVRDFGLGKPVFEDRITTEAHFMLEEIESQRGSLFSPSSILPKAVSNVMCSVVFGSRFEYSDPIFVELLRSLYRNLELMGGTSGAVLFMPYSYLLARVIPFVKECLDNMQYICDFTRAVLEEHLSDFDSSNLRDFIDVIIKETRNPDQKVTLNDLYGTTVDLFAAGTETSSTTLEWALLYMVAYPEIQRRVQDELDCVVGRNRMPRIADRNRLPYTNATLQEVQRMGSIIPLGVPHEASTDVSFRGYRIPKGTLVLPNLWALGTDPALWPLPQSFKPERFLNGSRNEVIKPDELIPFCTGRRACVGEQLAKMELFIFFTHLLHRFTISRPEGLPPVSFEGQGGVSLAPRPFKMCAQPRS